MNFDPVDQNKLQKFTVWMERKSTSSKMKYEVKAINSKDARGKALALLPGWSCVSGV